MRKNPSMQTMLSKRMKMKQTMKNSKTATTKKQPNRIVLKTNRQTPLPKMMLKMKPKTTLKMTKKIIYCK